MNKRIAPLQIMVPVAIAVVVIAGCNALSAPKPVPKPVKVKGAASPIGINLTSLDDYSDSYPFVDVFKQSRAWISGLRYEFDDHRPLDLDERGWVKSLKGSQVARTIIFPDVPRYPKGKYTVFYEGKGKIVYDLTATGPGGVVQSPGKDIVDVDAGRGQITINIIETDPKDPIRNIRMIVPPACKEAPTQTCDPAAPVAGCTCIDFAAMKEPPLFHPAFLADHKGFGAVRFMDWFKTNESTVSDDKNRPHVDDARWSPKGAPYEIAVAASEALDADPWINIPHLATDEYVKNLATYLRDHVRKDRRIYIELSNEVWNDIFPQSKWATDRGTARGIQGNEYERRWKAYSARVVEIHKIFESVFGGTERIVRVMGAHAANPYLAEVELGYQDAYKYIDALAIAPYIGGNFGVPENAAASAGKSGEQLLSELGAHDVDQVAGWIASHKKIADKYGVKLIAYEGGIHTVALGPVMNNDTLNRLFDEMNRSAAITPVIQKYLTTWKDGGGELFVYFNDTGHASKFGRWGLREYVGQKRSEAPKLDAVLKFAETTPRWW